jgi:hypothetical protein
MKSIIAAAIAIAITAPAFADVSDVQAYFAVGNDSAAERVVHTTSTGDMLKVQRSAASANDSAAENSVIVTAGQATRADYDLLHFFAQGSDSAAERANY